MAQEQDYRWWNMLCKDCREYIAPDKITHCAFCKHEHISMPIRENSRACFRFKKE